MRIKLSITLLFINFINNNNNQFTTFTQVILIESANLQDFPDYSLGVFKRYL